MGSFELFSPETSVALEFLAALLEGTPCFGKPEPDEISITEDISDNTERKHRTIEQDIKEVDPHEGGKHGTKEQSTTVAGPQRQGSTRQ